MQRSAWFLILGLALVLVTAAAAGTLGREKIKYNAADQAAARAVSLKRADLRPASGWHGGPVKPDISGAPNCPNYHPDESDIVLTGAAATHWLRPVNEVQDQSEVLQDARMVNREWQRGIETPAAVPCFRSFYARTFEAAGARLISFRRIPFPHIATHVAAYRGVAEKGTRHFVFEFAFLGRGRTEIEVSVAGPYSARRTVSTETLRLARILVGRIQV
jgi:hypothetical protein